MTNAFKLIIGNYYQPSSDKDTSIEQLKISRDRINQNAKSTIILDGDFNFDHINWDIPCTMNNFLISLKNINLNRLSDSKKTHKRRQNSWSHINRHTKHRFLYKLTHDNKDHYHSSSTDDIWKKFTDRLLTSVKKHSHEDNLEQKKKTCPGLITT